jgi:hypothetical protein
MRGMAHQAGATLLDVSEIRPLERKDLVKLTALHERTMRSGGITQPPSSRPLTAGAC